MIIDTCPQCGADLVGIARRVNTSPHRFVCSRVLEHGQPKINYATQALGCKGIVVTKAIPGPDHSKVNRYQKKLDATCFSITDTGEGSERRIIAKWIADWANTLAGEEGCEEE